MENTKFSIWSMASRNLIDISDIVRATSYILENSNIKNQIINIANTHNYSIRDIVSTLEKIT
jgi:nucleoside-diphosphate-sugar epimerase